jgi:acetylglutamate kinase
VLSEALPYMRRHAGTTIVVKYGGHAMGDEKIANEFAQDIVLLKQVGINPIVVHGGGPQINAMLKRLDIRSSFVDGLRVTDKDTVEAVEMVLSGTVNKGLVAAIARAGGKAIGISGKDAGLVTVKRVVRERANPETGTTETIDLGFVGEPWKVDRTILDLLAKSEFIPVVAPVCLGEDGQTYNVNADTVAGAVGGAVGARRLLLLTDVAGVLDADKVLIPSMTQADAHRLIADGTISGGMIPKVETCLYAVEQGVEAAVILDGRVSHSIILELFTEDGVGTLIAKS